MPLLSHRCFPSSSGATKQSGRDIRIDLARGVALLIIFIDHVFHNPLAAYTLQRYGFIDAADVFVFLSGYSLGLIYTKEFTKKGHRACVRRALHRCGTLYLAHITTAVVLLGMLFCFSLRGVYAANSDIYEFFDHPLLTVIRLLTLTHTPHMLGILPLYILLTALTPFALYLFSKKPWLALGLSLAAYSLVQVFPSFSLRSYPEDQLWYFNVFSWQFLFMIGLLAGRVKSIGERWAWLDNRWVILGAVLSLLVIITGRHAGGVSQWVRWLGINADWLFSHLRITLPLTEKMTDHPIRLLNLLVFGIVGRLVIGWSWVKRASIFRPLVVCGRHSLVTFIVGIVLSEFINLSMGTTRHTFLFWALVNAGGVVLLCLAAAAAGWIDENKFIGPLGPRAVRQDRALPAHAGH